MAYLPRDPAVRGHLGADQHIERGLLYTQTLGLFITLFDTGKHTLLDLMGQPARFMNLCVQHEIVENRLKIADIFFRSRILPCGYHNGPFIRSHIEEIGFKSPDISILMGIYMK